MLFTSGRGLHLHPVPEGDAVLDFRRRRFGLRVVPRSIAVDLVPDDHVVVTRQPFPAADGVVRAGAEVSLVDTRGWEVVIALNHHGLVALRNDGPLPDRSHPPGAGGVRSDRTLDGVHEVHAIKNRIPAPVISVIRITAGPRGRRRSSEAYEQNFQAGLRGNGLLHPPGASTAGSPKQCWTGTASITAGSTSTVSR